MSDEMVCGCVGVRGGGADGSDKSIFFMSI